LLYAALDVDVLLDLRDALAAELDEQGKAQWAAEEFAAVRDADPPSPRRDPWRRTSGLHTVRGGRQLAVVRELWQTREEMARRRDIAPGRILPDRAIVAAAGAMPATVPELTALPIFSGPANRRIARRWLAAIDRARQLPAAELPPPTLPAEGPPPPRLWKDRDPDAARRLAASRAAVAELSEEHRVPVENLLAPDLLRRLCWEPPEDRSLEAVSAALRDGGARPWQVTLVGGPLTAALQ
jgi:ribonuclease D